MKRKLSLLMVLMMVLSLVPANFAFAASDSIVNTVTTSADGTVEFDLEIEPKGTGVTSGGVFELRLGENAEWNGNPSATNATLQNNADGSARAEFVVNSNANITITGSIKLSGASGDQRVTIESITNAGVSRQVLTYAVVTGTGNIVSRTLESKKSVTRAGIVTGSEFEIRETSADAMNDGEFTLRLPRNFEWAATTVVRMNGVEVPAADLDFNERDLTVDLKNTTVGIDRIIVVPRFTITRDASFGDVFVQIFDKEDTGINPEDVTIAEYKDFGVTLKVDNTEEIVAGQEKTNRDYRVKITLDPSGASFNLNRMVDFTVDGGEVRLASSPTNNTSFAGLDSSDYSDEFELMFNTATSLPGSKVEFEVFLKADWDATGEMTITASGAGVEEQTVKVADVLAPATIEADVQDFKIGVQGQTGSEITITETKAGSLAPGFYVIDFDRANFGVTFTRPSATVTEGDMEVARNINNNGTRIWFEVKGESREASTIVLSGYDVSLDRTVPEGELKAKLAYIGTTRTETIVNDIANHNKITNFVIGKVVTAAPDATRPTTVFTIGSTVFTVAGEEMMLDAAPYISNNRTMLPIGTVAQIVGATVNYSPTTRTAVFQKDNLVVSMNLDTNVLLVNGVPVMMDAKPEIVNSRAFVPVVFVAQAFGIQNNTEIVYDAAARTVTMFPAQ